MDILLKWRYIYYILIIFEKVDASEEMEERRREKRDTSLLSM